MYIYGVGVCVNWMNSYFSHFPSFHFFLFSLLSEFEFEQNRCKMGEREMTFLNVCKRYQDLHPLHFHPHNSNPSPISLMLTTHFPIFNDFSCSACSNYNSFVSRLFLLLLSFRSHHRRRNRVCFSEQAKQPRDM